MTPVPPMQAPTSGVAVRMYRQGHGDCYLLAFPSGKPRPIYMLIDCGFKPGSDVHAKIGEIVEHIAASTGGHIDIVAITHEHQDHVNGIWKKGKPYFDGIGVGEAWLAWTEDPNDDVANELRRRHKDQLLGLLGAQRRLAAAGGDRARMLEALLTLELGDDGTDASFAAAAKDPASSTNKQSIKLIKDKAGAAVRYIRPHGQVMTISGSEAGVRVYALGPPRDANLLADEDPQGAEAFPGHGFVGAGGSFLAAAMAANEESAMASQPFMTRFGVPLTTALTDETFDPFFREHYGVAMESPRDEDPDKEPVGNPAWRRIDHDWLGSAEDLALALNRGINNTSLVLAFELVRSGKVLLFAADAQRGNWRSWSAGNWMIDGRTVTTRDLLNRTVLYKVGHHGSHNATLGGTDADDWPNLSWMAHGDYGREFTAMINAVEKWAHAQDPVWEHPLPSIKQELLRKAAGRVFQTDTDEIRKPDDVSDAEWAKFMERTNMDPLYFEYTVLDQ